MADEPQTNLVTTEPLSPNGATKQEIITTQAVVPWLQLALIFCAFGLGLAGGILWAVKGASEATQWLTGTALLVFASSGVSVGGAVKNVAAKLSGK